MGGMGDVVTALGRAIQEEGHHVSVILPKYDILRYGAIADLTQGRDFWFEGVHTRAWHGVVEGARPLLPPGPPQEFPVPEGMAAKLGLQRRREREERVVYRTNTS